MPQMSPLNWLSLFLSFSLVFMLINCTNYFFISYSQSKKNIMLKFNKINWKW